MCIRDRYKSAFLKNKNSNISIKYYKPNIKTEVDGYQPFYLPHFLLNLDEWSAFLLASDATQRPFWDKVLQESYRFYQIGGNSVEKQNKYVNYLRHRVCSLIFSTLRQADSATARITTAASVLGSIANIINSNQILKNASTELIADIEKLKLNCSIIFGENKIDKNGKNDVLIDATYEVYSKVNEDLVQDVINSKIKYGESFDHKFLKIAAELILLEEDARGNKQIRGYTATMFTPVSYTHLDVYKRQSFNRPIR